MVGVTTVSHIEMHLYHFELRSRSHATDILGIHLSTPPHWSVVSLRALTVTFLLFCFSHSYLLLSTLPRAK